MEKMFLTCATSYATEEEAINAAKRKVASGNVAVAVVWKAIARVEAPVPEAVVTKL